MAPSLRAPSLSDLLRTADGFVSVAAAVCLTANLRACTVTYHVLSGRPLCSVDATDRTDEERLAYLDGGWREDELMTEMIERRSIVVGGDEVLIPIIEPRGIVASIRCGHERERELWMISMLVAVRLIQLGIGAAPEVPTPALTPRQRQVAGLAAQGLSTKEIAADLGISPSTVKKLLKKVFDTLLVDNRVELVHQLRAFQVQLDVEVGVRHEGPLAIAAALTRGSAWREVAGGTSRTA